MKQLGVYYRIFNDCGTEEIGVLEEHPYGLVMDVGDFAYFFTLDLSQWTYLGEIE